VSRRVALGNHYPIFKGVIQHDPTAVTMVHIPEWKSTADAIRDIAHDDGTPHLGGAATSGLWKAHSGAAKPAWVSCPDDPELEQAIAQHFGIPAGPPAAA
jgi:hypothetical protein